MSGLPLHLEYDLTRRQRLVPHLKVWGARGFELLLFLLFFSLGVIQYALHPSQHPWRLLLSSILWLLCLLFSRNFVVGLVDVLLHRTLHMDILIEEKGLGFLAGGELWWFFLDGVTRVEQLTPGLWSILHRNGTVVHIPAALITEDVIQRIRAAGEHGRTPEGIQAAIKRGRLIGQIEARERTTRRGGHQES